MSLKITRAGILDTIQDQGRYGYQHQGINPGGAMDRFSASLANALLGKELHSPVIEMHFPAAQIHFEKSCIICISGADFSPTINQIQAPLLKPIVVTANTVLQFTALKKGARCYLSLLYELQLAPWLNSYNTNLKAVAGGYKGRKLQRGDEIPYKTISISETTNAFSPLPWRYQQEAASIEKIEVIFGHEWNWLTEKSQTKFLNNPFVISSSSDRMGYRLQGEALEQLNQEQLVSSAVSFGTVQLLPNGQIIVLMADHQTTGGYPRIAHVITAHLPRLAQMNAGEKIKFEMTSLEEAEKKLVAQQNYLMQLQNTCNLKMQNWFNAHGY